MTNDSSDTALPLPNGGSPTRQNTGKSESSVRYKLRLRHKHSLGKPLDDERYLEVIDFTSDGSQDPQVYTRSPQSDTEPVKDLTKRDSDFIGSLPSQASNVIRVVLDGDESKLLKKGHEKLTTGPQCVKQEMKTYTRKLHNAINNLEDLAYGKAYCWPHLKELVSGQTSRKWFCIDTFAYHNDDCSYWKGDILSKLQYTGNHESSRAYFTVARDSKDRCIIICLAPFAATTAEVGPKDVEQGRYRPDLTCVNANWRWLSTVKDALTSDAQSSSILKTLDPEKMLEHLVLRILVGSHARNMKLLETLQGADILARWHVHTARPNKPEELNRLSELVVALRSIERAMVGLSRSINWLDKGMRKRLEDAGELTDDNKTLQYLRASADECEYSTQEISTQLSLHNELYKVLAQRISIEQANSVNQLTLLAAFFLPLSLAAAVLSMQTRFVDLNLLLYDFLGVMVILGALASVLAILNTYGRSKYNDALHKVYFALRAFPSYPRRLTVFWMFFWVSAVLASFLLGMLKNVTLGLKVLGYEAAAIMGLWLLSIPAFRLFVIWRKY